MKRPVKNHVKNHVRRPVKPDDRGSSIPLVLLCVLIALMLVAGAVTTGAAFLAQRDLQSDCDGAAVAGANGLDADALYRDRPGPAGTADTLPLATDQAAQAVDRHRAEALPPDPSLDLVTSTDGATVRVDCRRVVAVPFGAMWGKGDGLERRATSTARSRLRD